MNSHDIFGCPFCAHDNTSIINVAVEPLRLTVQCKACWATGPIVTHKQGDRVEDTQFEAITRWNNAASVRNKKGVDNVS